MLEDEIVSYGLNIDTKPFSIVAIACLRTTKCITCLTSKFGRIVKKILKFKQAIVIDFDLVQEVALQRCMIYITVY